MAYPYEWSDEERARDEARRRVEQERMQPPGRPGRDYETRGYDDPRGEERMWGPGGLEARGGAKDDEAFYARYDEPHAYDRRRERMRGDEHGRYGGHRSFEEEAYGAGRGLARGWRRLTEGAHHLFEDDRRPAERDPRRAGGMFGGDDRPGSLFNHDDGLGPSGRPGSHRGKGPKGYVRRDERVLEEVCERLTEDDRLYACDIEVKVEAGEVTLNGQVRSREDKRRAEDLAESVSGVQHLQNNLRVRPPEPLQAPAERSADPAATGGHNATAAAATGTMGSTGGVQSAAPTSAQITDQSSEAATPAARAPRPN